MYEKLCTKVIAVLLFLTMGIISSHSEADSVSTAVATTASQPNPVYSALEPDLDLLGRLYGGPVYSSVVSGNYVYFGTGGGVRVLKIKNSRKQEGSLWEEVASIESSGVVRDLDV